MLCRIEEETVQYHRHKLYHSMTSDAGGGHDYGNVLYPLFRICLRLVLLLLPFFYCYYYFSLERPSKQWNMNLRRSTAAAAVPAGPLRVERLRISSSALLLLVTLAVCGVIALLDASVCMCMSLSTALSVRPTVSIRD